MNTKFSLIVIGIWIASASSFYSTLNAQSVNGNDSSIAAVNSGAGATITPKQQQAASFNVDRIDSIGLTVHDMDAEVKFFTEVLSFKKTSDNEIVGEDFEELLGVFGSRIRVVRLQLGSEFITLTQFLAPRGRPIPVDSSSNDGWFQHIAVVVSNMEQAYAYLRKHKIEHASTGPQTLPDWNPKRRWHQSVLF